MVWGSQEVWGSLGVGEWDQAVVLGYFGGIWRTLSPTPYLGAVVGVLQSGSTGRALLEKEMNQIFVSTKKVRAATSVVAVLVCPDGALALLPGSRSAAGWAELLPSVCLRQQRTSQHSSAVGSGSPPSRSPWFSLWLPG